MTTTTLTFTDLDTEATILEAHAKRVHRAAMQGVLFVLGTVACYYLRRAKTKTRRLRTLISGLDIRTADDRAHMAEGAKKLAAAAAALNAAYEQLERAHTARAVPVVGAAMMRYLDDVACMVEDIAETAALGASKDFADTVRAEVRKIEASSRQVHA